MAWNTPKTDWATGNLVAADDLNKIGQNFNALKSLPTDMYITTSTIAINQETFTDVDTTNLNLTIETDGGDVMVHFDGPLKRGYNVNGQVYFDVEMDDVRLGDVDGIAQMWADSGVKQVSFTRIIQNVSAGSHTFILQARETISGNDADLLAGANFWVREI